MGRNLCTTDGNPALYVNDDGDAVFTCGEATRSSRATVRPHYGGPVRPGPLALVISKVRW